MRHLNELGAFLLQIAPATQYFGKVAQLDVWIADCYTDSRQVQANSLFIALAGHQAHGHAYIESALALGAVCVLTDEVPSDVILSLLPQGISVWVVPNLVVHLPKLAAWFYDSPSTKINLIGITGTNGKTSTAFYTAQLLSQLTQQPVAMIGTLGYGQISFQGIKLTQDWQPSANTTPDVVMLNRILAQFVALGIRYCVMEVSSHALILNRIVGLAFNAVALTQITRDHLDFHETETAYRLAKKSLFEAYPARYQVLNVDDEVGQAIYQAHSRTPDIFGYSLQSFGEADLRLLQLKLHGQGMMFEVNAHHQVLPAQAHLMGRFNAENLACAMSLCLVNGFALDAVVAGLAHLQAVTGRMEKLLSHPTVLVDYAHTPDALKQALLAMRQHMAPVETTGQSDQKLWVVFGCGGNRDKGKRSLMGRVAQSYADFVVLTDDNPRCEASYDILHDILQGFDPNTHPQPLMIPDRLTAITTALAQANALDMVLIAGKGHETYQALCQEQIYFSDQATVLAWKKNNDLDA